MTPDSQPAILVEGLHFAYRPLTPGEDAPLVIEGLDLQVESGEWLAVMGASDAGKTTLCLLLAGLAPHLTGGEMDGRIVVAGQDTAQHPPPALTATAGILFQEPESQLFNSTVEAEVAWGLENLGVPVPEIEARVHEALSLLRLEHLLQRRPNDLSGGEKKRLALAAVLAMRPDILILDEPMGGLDPAGRREVLDALAALRDQGPKGAATIVMAESDPEAVGSFADRLLILRDGRKGMEGPPRELFQRVDELAALGVDVPQMARISSAVNRQLGTAFDFLTVKEARAALAVRLG